MVLVIGDVPTTVQLLVTRLRDSGFIAQQAATPFGAQTLLRREPFHAVIIDPGFDEGSTRSGIALYEWLRQFLNGAKILMVGNPAYLTDDIFDEMRRCDLTFVPERDFDPRSQLL
ncbi:MAG: response regulator [Phycisphaerales bacterium]|nr:response regulator [Phycisphaerales bacterium]